MMHRSIWALAVALMLGYTADVRAFDVYNDSSRAVHARLHSLAVETVVESGDLCTFGHLDDGRSGSRSPKQATTIAIHTAVEDRADFICVLHAWPNGWAVIREQERTDLGVPPDLYCESYTADGRVADSTFSGRVAGARSVQFLASADCQYQNGDIEDKEKADATNADMTAMIESDNSIRGILYAGDLTQNTRADEWEWYTTSLDGFERYVFDGLGNHDEAEPDFFQAVACLPDRADRMPFRLRPWLRPFDSCVFPDFVRAEMRDRDRATTKTNKGDPHYSWD